MRQEFFQLESEKIEDLKVGTEIFFTKTVSEGDVYLFAGVTGDFSPNHVDEEYMRQGRIGKRVVHGALIVGLISAASARMRIGRTVSVGFDNVRFLVPVFFGDTITTHYKVAEIRQENRWVFSRVICTNQAGLAIAYATHIRAFVD